MKKLILTTAICTIMACPAYADNENITDENKGCTSDTLTVDSGTAALEADWQANTVYVKYYKDGTEIQNIGSTYASCTYDDTLTLPTAPSKDGYTFAGWTVRAASCGLSSWDSGGNGKYHGFMNLYEGGTSQDVEKYGLTTPGDWAVEFDNGIVKGVSTCNDVSGTADFDTNVFSKQPSDSFSVGITGGNCWCMVTEVDNKKCSDAESFWIYRADVDGPGCVDCPFYCAYPIEASPEFRAAAFGSVQQ